MFRRNLLKIPILFACLLLSLTSCFKGVDFEQAQDIALTPDLEVDLLYYSLDETDFSDSETNVRQPIIRDTVRLEFLDDDYIQDGLMFAELRYRHENSFAFPVRSSIKFLSENNRTQFSMDYEIQPGNSVTAGIVDTLQVLEGAEIRKLRRSIKMMVELEMIGDEKETGGNLDFSSKGLFRFEF